MIIKGSGGHDFAVNRSQVGGVRWSLHGGALYRVGEWVDPAQLQYLRAAHWRDRPIAPTSGQCFYCIDRDSLYTWHKERWQELVITTCNTDLDGWRTTSCFVREPIPAPEVIEQAVHELVQIRKDLG